MSAGVFASNIIMPNCVSKLAVTHAYWCICVWVHELGVCVCVCVCSCTTCACICSQSQLVFAKVNVSKNIHVPAFSCMYYKTGCFRGVVDRELTISGQSWFEVRGFEPHLRLYLGTI